MKCKFKLNCKTAKKTITVNEPTSSKSQPSSVSYYKLFRYATAEETLYITLGLVLAIVCGAITPLLQIVFGEIIGAVVNFQMVVDEGSNDTIVLHAAETELMRCIYDYLVYNILVGIVILILSYGSVWLVCKSAIGQIARIQSLYMYSVLNKDISWFDLRQSGGDFSSRISDDLKKVEEAISEKFVTFVYYVTVFFAGVITAMVYGWELAIISLVYCPLSMVTMGFVIWISTKLVSEEVEAYAAAASIAEEILNAIRTVLAFNGEHKEIDRYQNALQTAKRNNTIRGFFVACNNGFTWFFIFLSYALTFYVGINFIIGERNLPESERSYSVTTVTTVFFNILTATWYFIQCTNFIPIFAAGRIAAVHIFEVIDDQPTINLSKDRGVKPKSGLRGNILFSDVWFRYPSRASVPVLQGCDLKVRAGETIALVGNSGCGKSTCIQLLQRLYDANQGHVLIDDTNIRDYNLAWLRGQIGVVSQEPILFGTTISENIRYGKPQANQEEIIAAACKANAHDFIKQLPLGYETLVGEGGAQLSGGQKQRVAIARALIRNPVILLLDEATSALDTHSEGLVQDALEKASAECTTIIVAHRLSTIRCADRIVVLGNGQVIEDGNHDLLMSLKGVYWNLVNAQQLDNSGVSTRRNMDFSTDSYEDINLGEDPGQEIQAKKVKPLKTYQIMGEILKLNQPEWCLLVLGVLGAALSGASTSIYAIIFGDLLGVLSSTDEDYVWSETSKYCLYFVLAGSFCAVTAFMQVYFLVASGEALTLRIRTLMLETVLKQEMSWFDKAENSVGTICTSLSSDAATIQMAAGQCIGAILQSLSSFGVSIAISFYIEWRLTLLTLLFIPFIVLAVVYENKILNDIGILNTLEDSVKFAIEAIGNIRTVASLGLEESFHSKYVALLAPGFKRSQCAAHARGFALGVARSVSSFCYGAVFYYGGVLIRDEHLDYTKVIKVLESLVIGACAMATAIAFSSNFQKAIISSEKLLKLIARKPQIYDGTNTSPMNEKDINVHYNSVKFSYPSRPEVKVLRGINLDVFQGQTVALVGPSGCGKSTLIQLLQRFYDPRKGSVSLGNLSIKDLKLGQVRSHLGIVSQEPNLFDRTIMENIAYGDNAREVTHRDVIIAAKKANIHNFIASLPLGYETRLGEKGLQLSGGQKQRIAIARALIRDPSVLILDEATSALDTESEKIVQEALNQAKTGRTCITIAHRLVTVQDADVICVLNRGVIEEQGTHRELLANGGLYYQLYTMQMDFN